MPNLLQYHGIAHKLPVKIQHYFHFISELPALILEVIKTHIFGSEECIYKYDDEDEKCIYECI